MKQLMVSFQGTLPPPDILAAVKRGEISSFCLFTYGNVVTPAQLYDLTEALYQAAYEGGQLPPIIGIDQEGGQLIAVTAGATELPGNMALGATRSADLAEQAGQVLGRELLAMGVNMNFAPSLDVNTNPANPVVGVRSFGEDPELVAELGAALIRGMQAEGVIATAKHFPGHGDTQNDSHYAMPVVPHPMQRTTAVELMPFREAIHANVGAIMTAHVVFSAIDNHNPATLSSAVLNQLLRQEMGYTGLTITDAMDMHAVAQFGAKASVRAALEAGADLVLLGHLPQQLELLRETADLLQEEAVARIQAVRAKIPLKRPPLSVVGNRNHQHIAQMIADRSITIVRDHGQLPLRLDSDAMVAVISVYPTDLTPADTSSRVRVALADAVRKRHGLVQSLELAYKAPESHVKAVLQATEQADLVIVGTINASNDPIQAELVRAIHERGQKLSVIALRTPYDLIAFPMIETYLCSYGIRAVSMEAVVKVLFGEIEAQGTLPCTIPGLVDYAK